MTNHDECRVRVGFRKRKFPDVVERVFGAVDDCVVGGIVDGDASLGVGSRIAEINEWSKAEEIVREVVVVEDVRFQSYGGVGYV